MPHTLFHEEWTRAVVPNRMLEEIRAYDWQHTSVGLIAQWPEPVKHAVRTMLLSASAMTILVGREGLALYNDATREMFGSHYDGSLGRSIFDILPHAAGFYRRAMDEALAGRGVRYVDEPLKLFRGNAWRTGWFRLSFTPICDHAGAASAVLVIVSETTDRVEAQSALRAARERLELALGAGNIMGIWDLDVGARRVAFDPRFAAPYGFTPQEAQAGVDSLRLFSVIHPGDRRRIVQEVSAAIRARADYRCQFRTITAAGVERSVLASGHPVFDAEGALSMVSGVIVDLTEKNAAQAALAESRLRLETLTDAVPHLVWSADDKGSFDYFNRRFREFTGMPADGSVFDLWKLIHSEDLPRAWEAWQASLFTGAAYDMEYRFRHFSGEYRWVRAMALPMRTADGRVVRWYGTSTDIHDTKLLGIERELVSRELDHRIKNLFALVNGLVGISVRENPELVPVAEDLRRRLGALHNAHGYIRIAPAGASAGIRPALKGLIAQLLEPYANGAGGPFTEIEGDDEVIDEGEVSAFALVIHELATNSAKYGALGDRAGRLHVAISRCACSLRVLWNETAPRIPALPATEGGFGSRLLKVTIETQLRGEIVRRQRQGSLAVDMRFQRPPAGPEGPQERAVDPSG